MDPGERVALASVGVNAGLSLTKLGLSFMSGSLALAADALHSFTDVVLSGMGGTEDIPEEVPLVSGGGELRKVPMTLVGVALTVAVTYAFSRYELREEDLRASWRTHSTCGPICSHPWRY
ncbi:MAG TPA: hypothetical protein EYP61_01235 [Candidatus Latescibacteria bacterium]|nr:hypothetical protein [Candidatus Latescibacterota bacterium]